MPPAARRRADGCRLPSGRWAGSGEGRPREGRLWARGLPAAVAAAGGTPEWRRVRGGWRGCGWGLRLGAASVRCLCAWGGGRRAGRAARLVASAVGGREAEEGWEIRWCAERLSRAVLRCCGREVVSGALLVAAPLCRGMLSALGSRCHQLHAAPPDGAALASAIPAPHSVLPSARVWNYHFSPVAFQPKGVEFILSHSFLRLPKTTTVFLVRAFSC